MTFFRPLSAATHETCRMFRNIECATFFARWQSDAPDSPELAKALQRERRETHAERSKRSRDLAHQLSPQGLRPLIALYGGDASLSGSPLTRAARLSEAYATSFQYAVPFDRSLLEAAWSRCKSSRCALARSIAETRLGPLGPPLAAGGAP